MAFDFDREVLGEILRRASYDVTIDERVMGATRYRGEPATIVVDARGHVTLTRERILEDSSRWRALRWPHTYDVTTERRETTTIRGVLVSSQDLATALPEIEHLLDQRP